MPQFKLCYFNSRGLGEMARLLFAEAGVAYEDVRYSIEEWPEHKPTMQFGQMPVLFVDGVQIAHSRALVRYLARYFKLEGESPIEAAQIDVWIEVIYEAFYKLPLREQDEAVKAEKVAAAMKDAIGPKLEKIQEQINCSPGPYILKEFSAADAVVYVVTDMLINLIKVDLSSFPGVLKLREAISQRPNIKKWLETRPVTEN